MKRRPRPTPGCSAIEEEEINGATLLVAQFVEALSYKSEGRGFDSRLCHWNFSLT